MSFIKFFLDQGEVIRCLTTGYSPISWLEQLLTGLAFVFLKRAMFIFTDRRILVVPTSFNRSPHSSVSQIMYEDAAAIALKGRTLLVAYKNGLKETFTYMGRKEKKKIKALISHLPIRPKEAGRLQERSHLCPGCAHVLPKKKQQCQTCGLTFKNNRAALIMALLIPGGGYFYSGYPLLALGFAALEILLLSIPAVYWTEFSKYSGSVTLPTALGSMLLLALTKWISAFHTMELIKDFMPRRKDFSQRRI